MDKGYAGSRLKLFLLNCKEQRKFSSVKNFINIHIRGCTILNESAKNCINF